jgi:hypothetical protein
MNVRVITSFDLLPAAVERASRYPSAADFFSSLDWYELLFAFGTPSDRQPRIYMIENGQDESVGTLVCSWVPQKRALLSLTNYYSLSYGVIAFDPRALNVAIAALGEYLASERPRWHTIDLRFLRSDTPDADLLVGALRARRFATHRFFQYENWFAPVAGMSFEDYWKARPSQLRNTVRRRAKKAEQLHRVQTRILTAPGADLEDAIAAYTQVYASSWKQPEPFPRFMPSLIRRCAELGILRLGDVHVDGHPAASQVWIVSNGRAVIYKLAYDQRFQEHSFGSSLTARLMEHVLDVDGVREVDYGVGSEPYKRDWMTDVRRVEGIAAYNLATAHGAAVAAMEFGKGLARRVYRR